ncbi:MAG: response regulator transcription factor [Acidobacteriaceae bacterium]|nr:response regulator transcription factor [Acidobacteriaceae bacterium]MBV9444015.1 response regulator transcription factor [Acidobacteriaceae bacterium]
MSEDITVLLVDDHSLVRRGFRRILEDEEGLKIAGEANNGIEAIRMASELKPNVVVMDLSMPELDGVQATKEIVKHLPETQVLVLSMHADDNYVRNALDAGARGYLLKSAIDVDLVGAIRSVAEGKRYMGSGLKYVAHEQDDELNRLTAREKQVLQLIAQGRSNKEIANLLDLSVNTVSVHRANLMEKMNIHRTAELVLFAIRKGLVAPQ